MKLQFTESQLTSYIVAELASQTSPILSDPQVTLRDGTINLYGRAHSGIFEANVRLAAAVGVDGSGLPELRITALDLGPLPATEALKDALGASLRETLTGTLGPVATGFRLETIDISNGTMTVTGRIR